MVDISDYDKDKLAAYAKKEFGADLDMRKKLETLRAEVANLQIKPSVIESEKPTVSASHVKNKETGFIFPYTKLVAEHLGERCILCDQNGEPVK